MWEAFSGGICKMQFLLMLTMGHFCFQPFLRILYKVLLF